MTGVQTCALPICAPAAREFNRDAPRRDFNRDAQPRTQQPRRFEDAPYSFDADRPRRAAAPARTGSRDDAAREFNAREFPARDLIRDAQPRDFTPRAPRQDDRHAPVGAGRDKPRRQNSDFQGERPRRGAQEWTRR